MRYFAAVNLTIGSQPYAIARRDGIRAWRAHPQSRWVEDVSMIPQLSGQDGNADWDEIPRAEALALLEGWGFEADELDRETGAGIISRLP